MFSNSFARKMLGAVALMWLGAGLAGCGGNSDPTKRFDLSGTVTFDGKPVPAGTILFEPDAGKGNKGPAGFATIADGKFDTSVGGKGTIGGPHVARLSGSEGKSGDGAPLFADFTVGVNLPKEKSTQKFEVPATAKAPAGSRPGPGYKGP